MDKKNVWIMVAVFLLGVAVGITTKVTVTFYDAK